MAGFDRTKELKQIFSAAVARVAPKEMITRRMGLEGDVLAIAADANAESQSDHGDDLLHRRAVRFDLTAFERIVVLGAGKAAAKMAAGVCTVLGDRITEGFIAVKDPPGEHLEPIQFVVAGHPVPDEASVAAARRIAALADQANERTLFVNVISGGGSALLCYPYEPNPHERKFDETESAQLTLEEKQEVTRLLLASGATIQEVNCVRKHLSRIKGGQLARSMYPAASVNLILSDVVGDDLDAIASGLIAPDPTTFNDALRVISRFGMENRLPRPALRILQLGAAGRLPETPKPGDPVFSRVTNLIIGSNTQALEAARAKAQELGYNAVILSSQITGEAREIARVYLGIGKDVCKRHFLASPPACIIAGGETTVTIRGAGKGGRNQEMALSFLREMEKQPADTEGLSFLSAGTDGSDGPTDAAGAFADKVILDRAVASGLSPEQYLSNNDAYRFFRAAGGLLKTGPTDTNVCDIQILLVEQTRKTIGP